MMIFHKIFPVFFVISIISLASQSNGQIIIDNKGNFNTNINSKPGEISIQGGSSRNRHLRHKFVDFNIKKNQKVFFEANNNIKSIIAEVTGIKSSRINGYLGANSNINILFINPNGIVFGQDAKLDLGGSLIVSTANSVVLNKNNIYLQFNNNRSAIKISGIGHDRINPGSTRLKNIFLNNKQPTGLDLKSKNSIQLIAGKINLNGGVLTAPSGNIEVVAVERGQVSASNTDVGYNLLTSIQKRGSINLQNRSFLNASGTENGNISLIADKIFFNDASLLHVENFGNKNLGEIILNAKTIRIDGITDKVPLLPNLSTFSRGISSVSNESRGPDVRIKSNNLILKNQGNIVTYAESIANGGDIFLNVSEKIIVDGKTPFNPNFPIGSFLGTITRGKGNAGNIDIKGSKLSILDGANLQSITLDSGNGGNVEINLSDSLKIDGVIPISNAPSNISSITLGTIDNRISGNSGTTSVSAKTIRLTNGGIISSSSFDDGDSGSILAQAENIEISGAASDLAPSQIIASSEVFNPFLSRLLEQPIPSGDSGNIVVTANKLLLKDSGSVAVRSDGTGNSGNIFLDVNNLELKEKGNILASTNGGDGGSVSISSNTFLLDSGKISATSAKNGLGGNIGIKTLLLATKGQSSVEANAENNFAGKVSIETEQLIARGNTRFSASSQAGSKFDGQVIVNQGQENLNLVQEVSEPKHSVAAVTTQCTNKGEITNHGSGINLLNLSETQRKALDLKQRLKLASQFTYLDHKTGERKPFKRWLGIQREDDGNLEFVFSPEQSKTLQKMLSSLDNVCLIKS